MLSRAIAVNKLLYSVEAWDPDAVRAGIWHSIDSMSGLAPPGIHSADEIALVAFDCMAVLE